MENTNQNPNDIFTITEAEYNAVSEHYRGVYSSDNIHGTNFDGKRTLMRWEQGKGTCLLIEGASMIITK